MFSNFFDTMSLIGPRGKNLVPGVDCPSHATFLPASHVMEISEQQVTIQNAFCLFEFNTGMPLRRHHAPMSFHGTFYEGLPNSVLILRSILTVVNYSYLIDYIFYHTGAVEVKVVSTGYILATPFTANASNFGFQVSDNINGNLHHHMFSFKVDVDIHGTENRYRTLDISTTESANQFNSDSNANLLKDSLWFLKRRQKGKLLTNLTSILLSITCFIAIRKVTSSGFPSHIDS